MMSRNDRLSTKSMFRLRKCDCDRMWMWQTTTDNNRQQQTTTDNNRQQQTITDNNNNRQLDFFSILNSYNILKSRWAWPSWTTEPEWCDLGACPGAWCLHRWLRFRCWINFIPYMTIKSKKNVLEIKVSNFVIPGHVVKKGFGGLVWSKFWHWDTGHSLFVVWMSLEQQNVLFGRATLQKPQSSFRDKISNIMLAWQNAFPNAENLLKIQ